MRFLRSSPSTGQLNGEVAGCRSATLLTLTELSAEELAQLAAFQLGVESLPEELSAFLASRTQGNPFYVEELLHLLMDEHHIRVENREIGITGDLASIEVPDTVQGVLLTRLDRLPPVTRNIVRVAACVGRSFRISVLLAALPDALAPPVLNSALQQLQDMGLTLLDRADVQEYYFRHVLVQNVAYENLLFGQRRHSRTHC